MPQLDPFCNFQSLYILSTPHKVHFFTLFRLYNHFFCPVMDLQCSKWQIGLKIEDLVFFTSILPNIWPFLKFSEPLQPIYALQSAFFALFRLYNHFSLHLWIYSVLNDKLASKLKILYSGPLFCTQFGLLCTLLSLHVLFMT